MTFDAAPPAPPIVIHEIGKPLVEVGPACPGLHTVFLTDSGDGDHRADVVLGRYVFNLLGSEECIDKFGFGHLRPSAKVDRSRTIKEFLLGQ